MAIGDREGEEPGLDRVQPRPRAQHEPVARDVDDRLVAGRLARNGLTGDRDPAEKLEVAQAGERGYTSTTMR
jgi:hypothetical protein